MRVQLAIVQWKGRVCLFLCLLGVEVGFEKCEWEKGETYIQARVLGKIKSLVLQSMCEQVSFPLVFADDRSGCVSIDGSWEGKVFCSA